VTSSGRDGSTPPTAGNATAEPPRLSEAARVWFKIGLIGFGGPAGQIALMHRIVVDEKRWVDEGRFLHALNYCMLLPGPEAQQLATYLGWMLHRTAGGLLAGGLFVLPGVFVMLALSMLYVLYSTLPVVDGILYGIKASVLAIVVEAILRIGRRALQSRHAIAVALFAFFAIFVFDAPFPLIIVAAGAIGALAPATLCTDRRAAGASLSAPAGGSVPARVQRRHQLATVAIGAALWLLPTLGAAAAFGHADTFTQIGLFFTKMAVVTFGGAYAVLSYVAQQAVGTYAWLTPADMLAGLGLAETTPGPLIMVVQFVGFIAAYRDPGPFAPLTGAVIGGLLATWVTFVPSFLWIFLGAPYVERLRGLRRLNAALAAITAAVVGVILNLAVWFALHVLFAQVHERWIGPMRLFVPEMATLDALALAMTVAALVAMLWLRLGLLPTLGASAVIGLLVRHLSG
jgi:chromate transporter